METLKQHYQRYNATCPKCEAVAELKPQRKEGSSYVVFYQCTSCLTKYRQALTPAGAKAEMDVLELFKEDSQ